MDFDFGRAVTANAGTGGNHAALRKIGKATLGAALAGLIAVSAPAAAEETAAPAKQPEAVKITFPPLSRHVRRAARLPFNVSLKFDDATTGTAAKTRRPSLARFVRARGHGSDASTVDSYGPDRLVQSVTFPADAPLSKPGGTAVADAKDNAEPAAPGL